MVLSNLGYILPFKTHLKTALLRSLKHFDYLNSYQSWVGDYYDEGFKHLKIVEKAGLRAESRRKGHPETPHCLHSYS